MARTRTASIPIGFRRGWSPWQKDDLGKLVQWARDNGFEAIDLGRDGDALAPQVVAAGLRLGSVDLAEWQGMLSPDKGKRAAAVARNAAYVEACAKAGPVNHFVVMLPEDAARPRSENFGYMVESFAALAPTLERCQGRLVIEGWPGAGALCCTPETVRAFFREVPSAAMGFNYDPSHLIRMHIDPLRFLREFAGRVGHVHGKDTLRDAEATYEYGLEQPGTFAKAPGFGVMHWRYTIPGHGIMDWGAAFATLALVGYKGCVSVELEDRDFNGTEDGEKAGLLHAQRFLAGC